MSKVTRPIPKVPNELVRRIAAEAIAKQLCENDPDFGDPGDCANDIATHCDHGDGYEMAKTLERQAQWMCDRETVEILDGYSAELDKAMKQHLEEFRICYNIEPPLPLGTKVQWKQLGKTKTGTLDELTSYRPLSYAVKEDGDPEAEPPKSRRWILYYDEVEELKA